MPVTFSDEEYAKLHRLATHHLFGGDDDEIEDYQELVELESEVWITIIRKEDQNS